MVGIAGGIPMVTSPEDHVRLGDIVVSGEHGVIQYDLVKDSRNVQQVRSPARPPSASFLEAVKFLEVEMMTGQDVLSSLIARSLSVLNVKRPPESSDILLDANSGLVQRHPKDAARRKGTPRVFTGPIASANVLLKNSERREQLRDLYKVKAVEMESSGIADATWNMETGYLAIRGICDYCDQYKNDVWQQYAAVVAAAYTRALLNSIAAT